METTTETKPQTKALAPKNKSLKEMLGDESAKKRFREILGQKSAGFISSIISAHQANKALQECDPQSILAAAAVAASLDLPINPSLGQAALVPYSGQAQFQMQWKGYVQLAHRTGKYRRIHLAPVFEGQLVEYDEFKGVVRLDAARKKSDLVMGFYFYFELTNGFLHEAYWSTAQCIAHGWKFSKSFGYCNGQWPDDPLIPKTGTGRDRRVDLKSFKGLVTYKSGTYGMCAKTVVKNELSKWGPLSTEMQDAVVKDQAVFDQEGNPKYIDTTAEPTVDPEMPKRASEAKALPAPEPAKDPETPAEAAAQSQAGANDGAAQETSFIIEKVTTTEKGKKVFYCIYIDGMRYETPNADMGKAARAWCDSKTPVVFVADDGDLVEMRKA